MTPEERRERKTAATQRWRENLSPERKAERLARRRELDKAKREADPEWNVNRTRAWSTANPGQNRISAKASYDKHAKKRRADALATYHANRDEILAKRKAWREANPEKVRAKNHLRRQHGSGVLPPGSWAEILADFNNACAYCHQQMDGLEFEHMMPISRDGVTVRENVVPACPTCNRRKKDKSILEFWPFT